jgi:uncharacterized protein
MKIAARLLMMLGLIVWFSMPLHAEVRPEQFDRVERVVTGRDESQKSIVFRQAVIEMLVRISGDRNIERHALVRDMIDSPESWVSRYYFESKNDSSGVIEKMVVTLDVGVITQKMKEKGLPIWGVLRPLVIVWCVVEAKPEQGEGQHAILQEGEAHIFKEALLRAAKFRGVPLVFPLMDLTESGVISEQVILSSAPELLKQYSERYEADVVTKIVLSQEKNDQWRLYWQSTHSQEKALKPIRGSNFTEVAEAAIDAIVHPLVLSYAAVLNSGIETTLLFKVQGVKDLRDFVEVGERLKAFSLVKQSTIQSVVGDQVIYRILLQGDLVQFQQQLQSDGAFQSLSAESFSSSGVSAAFPLKSGASSSSPAGVALSSAVEWSYQWRRR